MGDMLGRGAYKLLKMLVGRGRRPRAGFGLHVPALAFSATVIIEKADEWEADLTVVGSHERTLTEQ
jgi:nucleotide-binding universal stress UspA family protein